jgi:hypothetical protein
MAQNKTDGNDHCSGDEQAHKVVLPVNQRTAYRQYHRSAGHQKQGAQHVANRGSIHNLPRTSGYLEKLSFRPNSALRAKILSSEYHLYACGKMFTRALILNENPNFARYPSVSSPCNKFHAVSINQF